MTNDLYPFTYSSDSHFDRRPQMSSMPADPAFIAAY
jgi:hypothetical protein